MPNLLKNMRINFISLVPQGANGEQVIWKATGDAPAGHVALARTLSLGELKKSEEKRMVYGIVYAVNKVDSQGDYSTAEEIEKAAYDFMKDLRVQNVDTGHNFEKAGAFVAESWIVKENDSLFADAPAGSWAVGIKVEENSLWNRVTKGEFRGLSMAGFGERVPDTSDDDTKGFVKSLTALIEKALGGGKTQPEGDAAKETAELLKQFNAKLDENLVLKSKVEELSEKITQLEKATAGLKAGPADNKNKEDYDVEGIL